MLFSKISAGICSLASAVSAITITYDAGYDEANRTLEELMCSDGENGVMWKYGWETQADVPSFPYIGGVQTISEWNSTNCGTCWQATYRGKTIYILAIDFTTQGLNIGFDAMNDLTSGRAWALGRVDAIVTEVPLSSCGL